MKEIKKVFKMVTITLMLLCFYLMTLVGSKNEEIRFKEKQIETLKTMVRGFNKVIKKM